MQEADYSNTPYLGEDEPEPVFKFPQSLIAAEMIMAVADRAGAHSLVAVRGFSEGETVFSRLDVRVAGRIRGFGRACGMEVLDYLIVGPWGRANFLKYFDFP
jgi:hypothetical protein